MKVLVVLSVIVLFCTIGCDAPPQSADSTVPKSNSSDSSDSANSNPSPGGEQSGYGSDGASLDTGVDSPGVDPPNTGTGLNDGEQRTIAEVGVGKQGENSRRNVKKGGVARMIASPAASLFAAREKIVFNVQIPKNMQLYKATHGYFPKSHDDFMQHIIKAGLIELPRLPQGQRYEYDAQSAQLMVVKPEGT